MQVGLTDFYAGVLNARLERAGLIAGNIANADTPNYKATDISFNDALAAQLGEPSTTSTDGNAPQYRTDGVVALNGNDVSLDTERVNACTANGEAMQATTVFLHQSTTDLVTALRPNPGGI